LLYARLDAIKGDDCRNPQEKNRGEFLQQATAIVDLIRSPLDTEQSLLEAL